MITVIVGLPGSGKYRLAKQVSKGRHIVEDMVNLRQITPDCVITSVILIQKEHRNNFLNIMSKAGWEVEWLFFENNPKKCALNEKRLTEKELVYWGNKYNIPEGAKPITIRID